VTNPAGIAPFYSTTVNVGDGKIDGTWWWMLDRWELIQESQGVWRKDDHRSVHAGGNHENAVVART
jgi:hypothetical protein